MAPWNSARGGIGRLLTLLVGAAMLTNPVAASADPDSPPARAAHIDHLRFEQARLIDAGVYSPAMNSVVRLRILRAVDPDAAAPTLYLLNGANGGVDGSWYD
ncbi:esterase family protein, partial [Nocardia sp. NPDC051052]